MFNFKVSGIAAGTAFVLSLVVGLFSGTGFLILLLRAFIFAIVFFALSCIIFWLVAQFIPELLNAPEDDLGFPVSGSRVDISLGDGPGSGAFPVDKSETVDDISARPSPLPKTVVSPLDQEGDAEYNIKGAGDGLAYADDGTAMGIDFGASGRAEALPDIDGISEAAPESAADMINTGEIGFNEPRRPKSSSRKLEMAGDFDPKELAQGIRTVLKKDDKG